MPIPDLLIANILAGSGNVQAAQLVGGTTITQIGALIPTNAYEAPTAQRKNFANCMAEYRGDIYLNYLTSNVAGVWSGHRWDGASWVNIWNYELTGAFPGGAGAYTQSLGTFVVNTGTVQRIFSVAHNSSNGAIRLLYADTDTNAWTFSPDIGVGAGPNWSTGKHIPFNNKLYILGTNGTTPACVEIDPIAVSSSSIPVPWPVSSVSGSDQGCFYVYNDQLFCAHLDANMNNADFALYEFTGGGWSLNTQITNDNRNTLNPQVCYGASCMFTDPGTGDLILITNGMNGGTQYGSMAFCLTPSGATFTVQELTTTALNPNGDGVIPSGLQPGARGAVVDAAQDRWFVVVNNDTPGSTEVYLFVAAGPAPGAGYTVYQWNGVGAAMGSPGLQVAGPSTIYSIPETPFGGGDRIYRNVGNQCMVESATSVLGGYRISYRVYGTQSGQSVTLWYNTGQEAPDQQATIVAQTGGSGITGGNTVTGITGDDGSTLFTLDWDLNADGIGNGDAVHLMLDIN